MNHVFIINPVAGKMKVDRIKSQIFNACKVNGIKTIIEITKQAGDATKIAKQYATQEADCNIYSVGGDGTLNEVVNGVVGTNATIGVIPYGSGNDFFKMLSNNNKNIMNRTINGSVSEVDVGKVNDIYFINIASIGIDAEIALKASMLKQNKLLPKSSIYMLGIISKLFTFKSIETSINLCGQPINDEITMLTLCNGQYYGHGKKIAPKAQFDDGLFDVCFERKMSKLKMTLTLLKVLLKKYEKVHRTNYVTIESVKELVCNVDGELIKSNKFTFETGKEKVKVRIPEKNH